MKKTVEILGLPVISITEGRELGMSKTLVINAAQGEVAAITIEDEAWYRGVKLIPYESVIAIGDDAVTVTNSENILTLEDAGDYVHLLDDNIRVIGTKAITKSGTIQGKISELFIGDSGKIEKCEITSPDGNTSEVTADQISIFGKQVTVIDPDGAQKKTLTEAPAKAAPTPAPAAKAESAAAPEAPKAEAPKAAPEAPKAEPAKAEAPKAEPKPVEAPKAAPAPKAEAPKPAAPKAAEAPKAAPAPKAAEAPKAAAKPAEAPKAAAPAAKEPMKLDERHRRFLLGKKAARTLKMDNGIVIVETGQEITEEVLQKAQLAKKLMDLSMNIQ